MHSKKARSNKRLRLRSPFRLAVTSFVRLRRITLPFNITDTARLRRVAVALTVINLTFLLLFALCSLLSAEIKDRVVAFVDSTAITLSELEETYIKTLKVTLDVTKDEVLNTMINKVLLLREAKKFKLEAPSEDELMREYIELKIRPFITIKEQELIDFYGHEFETVREEIETYLVEREINQRVKSHIDDLRRKAYIKIQLDQE